MNAYLLVALPAPDAREIHLFVDALRRCGARAVEREGDRFVALFPWPEDVDALVADVRSAVRASTTMDAPDPTWERLSREEWAARWRSEQAARRITRRIVVAPVGVPLPSAGERVAGDSEGTEHTGHGVVGGVRVGPYDVVIRLDPAVAFGTAEHATTRACLALLDGRVRPGDRVLDVGTGSGILAVAAARLGAGGVLALESDPVACDAARRNAEANAVADRVEVRERTVARRDLRKFGRFDGVVINIEARVSAPLVPVVPAALRPGGWFILSGVVGGERSDAVAAAEAAGLALTEERPERGWWSGAFERVGRDG
ncbi:MAG: 50S ribosomal protein L11 methyltransferase [Longimicrobiales bacterium]|nr:50S ribosomal protein L11 methyltransferase [Longimicrobiales bacterium]